MKLKVGDLVTVHAAYSGYEEVQARVVAVSDSGCLVCVQAERIPNGLWLRAEFVRPVEEAR